MDPTMGWEADAELVGRRAGIAEVTTTTAAARTAATAATASATLATAATDDSLVDVAAIIVAAIFVDDFVVAGSCDGRGRCSRPTSGGAAGARRRCGCPYCSSCL